MFQRENLIFRLLLLTVAFSGVAVCDESFGLKLTTESLKTKENTQYSYHYFVKDDKTGDYKAQKETKEGDSVHGSYSLTEPNGDLRTVTYTVGPGTGFKAKVELQSSGSPLKVITTSDATINTALKATKTEKPTTLESNVSHFPGGFEMDMSSKSLSDVKTEVGMKFSLKTNSVTEPVTESTKPLTILESKPTEKSSVVTQPTHVGITTNSLESSKTENSTFLLEGREISKDPIEKEIDEAVNSMPKLPELILSDNKTHFKFHKDPEEALLDERITQIARQLAETSLRREYEERKLGHFIPISVASAEPSTKIYLSKSFKFIKNDAGPTLKSLESSPLQVLTQVRLVPQYIYRQTLSPENPQQLTAMSKYTQKPEPLEQQTYKSITNPPDILKINTSEESKILKMKEKFNANYKTIDGEPVSVIPVQVPMFLQFFTPYLIQVPGSYSPQQKLQPQHDTATVKKFLAKGETPAWSDTTAFAPLMMTTDKSTENL